MKIRENAQFCEKCGINITDFEIVTKNHLAEMEKILRDKFEKDYIEMEKKLRERIEKEYQQKKVQEDLKKIETSIQKEKKQDLNKPEKIMKKFDILMCSIVGVLLSFIFTIYLYIIRFMDPILSFIIFSICFSVIAYLIVFIILKIKISCIKKY